MLGAITVEIEKPHFPSEEYIKDDEGTDRIRKLHPEHTTHTRNPLYPNLTNTPMMANPPIIFAKPGHAKDLLYDFSQPHPTIVPAKLIGGHHKSRILSATLGNEQTPLAHKLDSKSPKKLPSNDKLNVAMIDRNVIRTTSIFGPKMDHDEHPDSNPKRSPIGISPQPISPFRSAPKPVSPRPMSPNMSPIKIKPANVEHNIDKGVPGTNLTTKIALSNNKITQI
jgi:hypothetical protein